MEYQERCDWTHSLDSCRFGSRLGGFSIHTGSLVRVTFQATLEPAEQCVRSSVDIPLSAHGSRGMVGLAGGRVLGCESGAVFVHRPANAEFTVVVPVLRLAESDVCFL